MNFGYLVACCGALITAAFGQPGWTVDRIAFDWTDRTLAVPAGESAWLLHGAHATRLDRAGKLRRHEGVLPIPVTDRCAVASAGDGTFWLCGGARGRTFLIDPETWNVTESPPLDRPTTRGLRIVVHEGRLYAMAGGADEALMRLGPDGWERMPGGGVVVPLGRHSAGLYSLPGGLAAFGDHHVAWWDAKLRQWRRDNKIWLVLRLRPAALRGGMSAQEKATGLVLLTLGKGSRSLGVADMKTRRYFHLRPRLPGRLRHSGETLYVSGRGVDRRVVVLSLEDRQRWSIPVTELRRIVSADPVADMGSAWEVWNAMPWGGDGELIRERDGLANMVLLDRQLYTQRKNLVRRWHLDAKAHSKNLDGHTYGKPWISRGAAMATDGVGRIFMVTGRDRTTWVLHVHRRQDGRDVAVAGAPAIHEMLVTRGPELPSRPAGNTALCWHQGRLWATLRSGAGNVLAWRPDTQGWERVAQTPDALAIGLTHDVELLPDGDGLIALSGDRWARLSVGDLEWAVGERLPFAASADGGMAVLDPRTRRVYVVLGGGSRDMGVIDLRSGSGRLLEGHLPDAASVFGRRIWIAETAGERHLYLSRGHDSDELWRIALE